MLISQCMGSKFMWNFKGHLWNFTRNFEPIHRKLCMLLISIFICNLRYRWIGDVMIVKYYHILVKISRLGLGAYQVTSQFLKVIEREDGWLIIPSFGHSASLIDLLLLGRQLWFIVYTIVIAALYAVNVSHVSFNLCRPGDAYMIMTSANGNIFRVTGPLWGETPVTGGFP